MLLPTTNFTNFPISSGLPIFFVGKDLSNFFIFLTNSLTRFVLKGPGAMLITEISLFKFSIENDFSILEVAVLSEEDRIKPLPGSFIIDEEI